MPAKHENRIAAAEGERTAHGGIEALACQTFAGDMMYAGTGRGNVVEVRGWRNFLALERQHRHQRLDGASSAKQMAVHRFAGADR